MIKVTPEVCESIVSQFETMPKDRTQALLDRIVEENPEFIVGVAEFFGMCMRKHEELGAKVDGNSRYVLGQNALFFAAIAWQFIQTQAEVNALEDNDTGEGIMAGDIPS